MDHTYLDAPLDTMLWSTAVLPAPFCAQVISTCDAHDKWQPGTTVDKDRPTAARSCKTLDLSKSARIDRSLGMVHQRLWEAMHALHAAYAERNPALRTSVCDGLQVLRYDAPSDEYLSHYDSDGAPIANRQLSLILYLNGGDDGSFDGGVLQFPRHNRFIIPQAGVGAVFPSAYPYLHASMPVTRGVKYAAVTWYR